MANTFQLKLDLDKQTSMQVVRIRQGDQSGTTIKAWLYDHGTTYTVPNTAKGVYFQMRLPDGEHYYSKSIDASGAGYVQVTLDEEYAASEAGRVVNAYFKIVVTNSETYSTAPFVVVILPDALEGMSVPESYDSEIQDAIDRCNDAAEILETLTPLTNAEIDAITAS